jgi:hypothetical protein
MGGNQNICGQPCAGLGTSHRDLPTLILGSRVFERRRSAHIPPAEAVPNTGMDQRHVRFFYCFL